jgi:hypothetical protein
VWLTKPPGRETVFLRGGVEQGPGGAATRSPAIRVDGYGLHAAQVDGETIVDQRRAREVVAAASPRPPATPAARSAAAATDADVVGWAITAGRRSMSPFQIARAPS